MANNNSDDESLEVQLVELKGEMRAYHAVTTERLASIDQKLNDGNERFSELSDSIRDLRDRIDHSMAASSQRQHDASSRLSVLAAQVERQEKDLAATNTRINSFYKWMATSMAGLLGALIKIIYDYVSK